MFIAHAPAGYLLTKALVPRAAPHRKALWAAGLFFSVAPDLDLFWFYLCSDRAAPHHRYATHWPLLWIALFGAALLLSALSRKASWRPCLFVGFANVMLHLALDSVAAEIYWLAPFSRLYVNLVRVPATHGWWVWNFFLHWTFLIELFICLAARGVFLYGAAWKSRLKIK
jgi:inner membrane protein